MWMGNVQLDSTSSRQGLSFWLEGLADMRLVYRAGGSEQDFAQDAHEQTDQT